VGDALDDYLAWFAQHRKSTAATKAAADRHIRPALGEEEAARLTAARIRAWHEGIAATAKGTRRKLKPGKVSAPAPAPTGGETARSRRATANRVLTILKAALNRAYREGKIPSDAAWRRVQAFRGADSARVGYATEEQARRLLDGCGGNFRTLVRGALETGCRYGELTKAHVADFHPDGPSLLVRDTKSGKSRHVPLDKQAAKFLTTITTGRAANEHLFVRDDGKPWGNSHQARRLLEANRCAQIEPPINFHGLRHTWASLRIMRGLPLMVAARVLGHSTTRMVETHYGHLAESYVQQAVEQTGFDLPPEPQRVTAMRARVTTDVGGRRAGMAEPHCKTPLQRGEKCED
jgi:integrase